ncbi:unnamed protein product [Caenorhabditis brenneri]
MDDYSINYHDQWTTTPSTIMINGRLLHQLSPTLRELFGFEGDVELILASPTEDFNHANLHEPLFNMSSPQTNFSTDDTDESWTAGFQLVSNRDCSVMIEMHGTPMEHFHSGGGMSPNTVSQLSVSTISDDFDRVPSGPFANGTMNEQAELLDDLAIVVSPHLDNSSDTDRYSQRVSNIPAASSNCCEGFSNNQPAKILESFQLQDLSPGHHTDSSVLGEGANLTTPKRGGNIPIACSILTPEDYKPELGSSSTAANHSSSESMNAKIQSVERNDRISDIISSALSVNAQFNATEKFSN